MIEIIDGGTGASTAEGARDNLDVPGLNEQNVFNEAQTVDGQLTVKQPTNGANAVYIIRADDTSPEGTLIMAMNTTETDEFWRFDADGRFVIVDEDGDNLITLFRDNESVHLAITISTPDGHAVRLKVVNDAFNRLTIQPDGKLLWGPGTSGADVTLYRAGGDELKTDDNLTVVKNVVAARIGAGVVPQVGMHLVGPNGEFRLQDTVNDNANKQGRMTVPHFLNAEEPIMVFIGTNNAGNNIVQFGGGSAVANTATIIDFFAAPNTTTLSGTRKLRITVNGAAFGPTPPFSSQEVLIQPTAANKRNLVLLQFAGQIANPLEIQNSAGTVVFSVGSGGSIGMNGKPPATQSTGWSVANLTELKAFDVNTATLEETKQALGTLLSYMLERGDLGA